MNKLLLKQSLYLIFVKTISKQKIMIDGVEIERLYENKVLGVIIINEVRGHK